MKGLMKLFQPMAKTILKSTDGFRRQVLKKSPEILIAVGIAGFASTAYMTVKASKQADRLIEERKEELNIDILDKKEVIKTTWKCYVAPVIAFTTSSACVIGSHCISMKRYALMATMYKVTEAAYTEYREQVKPIIGEQKEKEIVHQIAQKPDTESNASVSPLYLEEGAICIDEWTGQRFRSTPEQIRSVFNTLHHIMIAGADTATVYDYLYELGLNTTSESQEYEWDVNKLPGGRFEPVFNNTIDKTTGLPALLVSFNVKPKKYRR